MKSFARTFAICLAAILCAGACGSSDQSLTTTAFDTPEETPVPDQSSDRAASAASVRESLGDPCPILGTDMPQHELGLTGIAEPDETVFVELDGQQFLRLLNDLKAATSSASTERSGLIEVLVESTPAVVSANTPEILSEHVARLDQAERNAVKSGLFSVRVGSDTPWMLAALAVTEGGEVVSVGGCQQKLWMQEMRNIARRTGLSEVEVLRSYQRGDASILGDPPPRWEELPDTQRVIELSAMSEQSRVGLVALPVALNAEDLGLGDELILCTRIPRFAWGDCTQVDGVTVWLRSGDVIELWLAPDAFSQGLPSLPEAGSTPVATFEADDLLAASEAADNVRMTVDVEIGSVSFEPVDSTTEPKSDDKESPDGE